MARKITPELEREILAKTASGESCRAVAAWLAAERGVKVTHQAIAQMLRSTRVDRAEVAKVVTREALAGAVISDIEVLKAEQVRVEKLTARLHARAHECLDAAEKNAKDSELSPKDRKYLAAAAESYVDLALKGSDRVKALADRKLHYSGADDDDGGAAELAAAAERVSGRLDSLARAIGARDDAEGAGADPG